MKRFLFVVALLAATPLHAQTDVTRADLVQRLYPGIDVRVRIADDDVISRFVSATNDTIVLESGAFALADAQSIAIQQRATKRGMKVGALIGAPAGALFGAFIMILATGLCEYECSDNMARDVTLGTLGFTAAGTLAGGTIGAVIGAATPQWFEITDPRVRIPSEPPAASIIGSASLTPAYARYKDIDAGGAGVRAAYTFHMGRFAFGPELGSYFIDNDTKIHHAGGIARIGTGPRNRIEPFASVGVGFYSWGRQFGSIQLGGYSAGAGVHVKSTSRKQSVFAEARWQDNLTNSGDANSQYGFYTIGIGGQLSW